MNYQQIIKKLKANASKKNKEGMVRFGINPKDTLGVSMPVLRKLGKEIGKDQKLSLKLWQSGIHEAKILASLIGEVDKINKKQMNTWVKDFDSWDVCDQVCMNLFDKIPYAYDQAIIWTKSKQEFVKRAGFALMAALSFHDKDAKDTKFVKFFPYIKKESTDERNFVRKAVNWALRQIGKRNIALNKKAIQLAKEIQKIDSKSARWIAGDALRELHDEKIIKRLK